MKYLHRLLIPVLALLTGCGSGLHPKGPPVIPDLTGNWQIQTNVTPSLGPLLVGSLVENGSQVSAVFRFADLTQGSDCGSGFQTLNFTGTINPDTALLSLQSAPFGSDQATLQAYLTINTSTYGYDYGTIAIYGSVCKFAQTYAVGVQFAPMTGTYAGTVARSGSLPGVDQGPLTLKLTQATTPTADGKFPVTGSAAFTGSTCSFSGAISGTINGGDLELVSTPDATGVSQLSISAAPTSDASQLLNVNANFTSGACTANLNAFDSYTGTLKR